MIRPVCCLALLQRGHLRSLNSSKSFKSQVTGRYWKFLSSVCFYLLLRIFYFVLFFCGRELAGGGGGIKGILNGTSWLVGLNFKAEK